MRYQAMAYQELQRALAQFSAAEQRLGPRPPASALGGLLPSILVCTSKLDTDVQNCASRPCRAARRLQGPGGNARGLAAGVRQAGGRFAVRASRRLLMLRHVPGWCKL